MAKKGTPPDPPFPPPGYAGLGRVQDPAVREVLRVALDRASTLEQRLAALEATTLKVGSPVDAYAQRIRQVGDPQQATDAVNLRTVQRLITRATVARAGSSSGGGSGGGGGTPPPPTPPPPSTSGLTVLGRGFALNGVRFDWRGITMFTLLAWLCNRISGTSASLDWCAANGITVPRILLSFKAQFWLNQGLYLDPNEHPDYWQQVNTLVGMCEARQLYPEIVIFGDVEMIYTTQGERLDFVEAVATRMRQRGGNVFMQIANEPERIGISAAQAAELANAYDQIDPGRLLTTGPDTHGGRNAPPNDYLTWHADRTTNPTPWEWVARQITSGTVLQNDRPPVSDEPINAGQAVFGGADAGADRWYAWGALSRLQQFSCTFHYEGGVFGVPPPQTADAPACYSAWRQGLADVNFDLGGQLFGHLNPPGGSALTYGPTPFSGHGGSRAIVGRHNGISGVALVLNVGGGWTPPLLSGWSATQLRRVGNALLLQVRQV